MTAPTTALPSTPRHALRPPGGPVRCRRRGPWWQAAALRASPAWWGRLPQVVWAVVLVALGLASVSPPVQAQLVRPFTARYTNNAPGDIYIIGNTLLSCVPTPPGAPLERPDDDDDPRDTCDPDIPKFGSGLIKDEDGRIIAASGTFLSGPGL